MRAVPQVAGRGEAGALARIKRYPQEINQYFKEVRLELKKVSWPTKREVYGTTLVVLVLVFFFGFYLWVVDFFSNYLVTKLLRLLGG